MDRAVNAFKEARRCGQPLAVCHLDLDGFKNVNDTLGHHLGDALLAAVAQRILGTVERVVSLEGNDIVISTSIGVSMCPDDGQDVADLLRKADMALYRAKEGGKRKPVFFTSEIEDRKRDRGEWSRRIGRWVIEEACAQITRWEAQGLHEVHVAVNISSVQFHSPELADEIERIVAAAGVRPEQIELEITESGLMEHPAGVARILPAGAGLLLQPPARPVGVRSVVGGDRTQSRASCRRRSSCRTEAVAARSCQRVGNAGAFAASGSFRRGAGQSDLMPSFWITSLK